MAFLESPSAFAEIEKLAENLLDRKTKNFVTDAFVLARWILSEGKRLAEAEMAKAAGCICPPNTGLMTDPACPAHRPSLRPVFEKEKQTLTNLEKLAAEMADEAHK